VFDQVRAALLRPEVLTAGEQALAVRTPAPDDELLAAELARLDRKLDAVDAERRRLIDLYQAGLIELPDLQRRAADVEHRRHDLEQRRDALTTQRQQLTRDNQLRHRVRHFTSRVLAVIDTLDFDQKQALLRLVVEDVHVTGWHIQIRLRIPLDENPPAPPNPNPDPDQPDPVSTQDRLRSLGSHRRRLLPHARSPNPTNRRRQAQLINPRGGDSYLATSGDRDLAVDTPCTATPRPGRGRSPYDQTTSTLDARRGSCPTEQPRSNATTG
jgi:hypothetical protein